MIIAREKKKENIVEYVLYMWQIENLIRAYNFDIERIDKEIISGFDLDDEERDAMRFWYESLIETMKNEKVTEKGHIQILKSTVADLNDLHLRLLKSPFHQDYQRVYQRTLPYISAFYNKLQDKKKSIIEMALEAVYGVWMLRLQGKKIYPETQEAIDYISDFLSLLAKKYHQREQDEEFYI